MTDEREENFTFSDAENSAAQDENGAAVSAAADESGAGRGTDVPAPDPYAARRADIENVLRKSFKKEIMSPFARAVDRYELLSPGDRVAVCISGGKDSFLMALCFRELKRRNKIPFELTFLSMDPGYKKENADLIRENAALLGVPLTVFHSDIFEAVTTVEKSPCYLCARMRRGYLYSKAKELGCNKIALGHHYDDVIETTLMSILYSGQTQTMMPKLHSDNFEGMELIRPMYFVREADICRFRDRNRLRFLRCACRFTEMQEKAGLAHGDEGKRLFVKKLIAELEAKDPGVEANIFRSMENIHLAAVLGYKEKDGTRRLFPNEYA